MLSCLIMRGGYLAWAGGQSRCRVLLVCLLKSKGENPVINRRRKPKRHKFKRSHNLVSRNKRRNYYMPNAKLE